MCNKKINIEKFIDANKPKSMLVAVGFLNNQYCLQYADNCGRTINYSEDGGNSWRKIQFNDNYKYEDAVNDLFSVIWTGFQFIAIGAGIVYSPDGINWISSRVKGSNFITANIFQGGIGVDIASNESRLIVVGTGTNTIAYSDINGINWTGLGKSIFSEVGFGIASNGLFWVVVGQGINTIAYSSNNGETWTGLGKSIFSNSGFGITWNGSLWVSLGLGTNSIAYSSDGKTWTPVSNSKTIFFYGNKAAWNGSQWVAIGRNSSNNGGAIAYSNDGISWNIADSKNIFSNCTGVTWNGFASTWVVVGRHLSNNGGVMTYSYDGINWIKWNYVPIPNVTEAQNLIFAGYANSITWNGVKKNKTAKRTRNVIEPTSGIGLTCPPIPSETIEYNDCIIGTWPNFSEPDSAGKIIRNRINIPPTLDSDNKIIGVNCPVGEDVNKINTSCNVVVTDGPCIPNYEVKEININSMVMSSGAYKLYLPSELNGKLLTDINSQKVIMIYIYNNKESIYGFYPKTSTFDILKDFYVYIAYPWVFIINPSDPTLYNKLNIASASDFISYARFSITATNIGTTKTRTTTYTPGNANTTQSDCPPNKTEPFNC